MIKDPETGEIRWAIVLRTIIAGAFLAGSAELISQGNRIERLNAIQEINSKKIEELENGRSAATSSRFRQEDADRLRAEMLQAIVITKRDLDDRITREFLRNDPRELIRSKR
jgi:hypothetical protein